MNRQNLSSFLQELNKEYPGIEVIDREEERLIYAHGCYPVEYKWILQGPYKYLPSLILVPGNTDEVSGIMRLSEKHGIGISLFPDQARHLSVREISRLWAKVEDSVVKLFDEELSKL